MRLKINRNRIYRILVEIRRNYFKRRVISYFKNSKDLEIKEIIDTIKKNNELNVFNYDFVGKYLEMDIDIRYDEDNEMHYVLENGKKLYFKRGMNADAVLEYYKGILIEQDVRSPHRYLADPDLQIENGDVIIDLGGGQKETLYLEILIKLPRQSL